MNLPVPKDYFDGVIYILLDLFDTFNRLDIYEDEERPSYEDLAQMEHKILRMIARIG
jgi:hypothetical protein